jgi:hypothetical protein
MEGLSRREVARRFGIDPRTVAKMLPFSVPSEPAAGTAEVQCAAEGSNYPPLSAALDRSVAKGVRQAEARADQTAQGVWRRRTRGLSAWWRSCHWRSKILQGSPGELASPERLSHDSWSAAEVDWVESKK